MKYFLILIVSLLLIISCAEWGPAVAFTEESKGKKINLSNFLGDSLSIKRGNDTINYFISYRKRDKLNTIINLFDGDTIFEGTVSKRKELFLLNRKIDSSTYIIHAIVFDDKTITGLETEWVQSLILDSLRTPYKFNQIVRDSNGVTALEPNKRETLALLNCDSIIIHSKENNPLISGEIKVDSINNSLNEFSSTTNCYPNPFNDHIIVESNYSSNFSYKFYNDDHELILSGEYNTKFKTINTSDLPPDTYILKVTSQVNNQSFSLIKNN